MEGGPPSPQTRLGPLRTVLRKRTSTKRNTESTRSAIQNYKNFKKKKKTKKQEKVFGHQALARALNSIAKNTIHIRKSQ